MDQEDMLALANKIADMQKDLIVVFKDESIVMTNSAFNKFFGVKSHKEYQESFGPFINNFVPHPSYFNESKIEKGKSWMESICELPEIDRVVSMLSATSDPHAFSVNVDKIGDSLNIVVFSDITQTLIKRIMIENHANIDVKTGAYAKQYFLQIKKSYEDAAVFNEKIIGLIQVEISSKDGFADEEIKEFVANFKNSIRQDDMLVKWAEGTFLLAFLVDDEKRIAQISEKLHSLLDGLSISGFSYNLKSIWQKNGESITKLLSELSER